MEIHCNLRIISTSIFITILYIILSNSWLSRQMSLLVLFLCVWYIKCNQKDLQVHRKSVCRRLCSSEMNEQRLHCMVFWLIYAVLLLIGPLYTLFKVCMFWREKPNMSTVSILTWPDSIYSYISKSDCWVFTWVKVMALGNEQKHFHSFKATLFLKYVDILVW